VVDRPAKDPPTAPDLNADTVALFANGKHFFAVYMTLLSFEVCQLMSTGPKGQGVDSMGRVYELEEPVDLSQK
jgi:hypothetical protein